MGLSCRLCLGEYSEDKLKNIFLCSIKYSKESLVDVLFWVFSVEIDATDPYTKDICSDCILLIEYVVEVRNTFQKNQKLLNKAEYEKEDYSELHFYNNAGVSKLDSGEKYVSPTHSPNRHSYSQSSPRVRVTLATLDALCPLRLNIVRFEDSPEYMHYKPLGHGRFKRMKYRHFRLDDKLLDDICSTLDDKKVGKNGIFEGDAFMVSQANKTDEIYESALSQNVASSKGDNEEEFDTDSLTELIKITKDISSHMLSPEIDKDYDWTSLNFKKDASTNTESNSKRAMKKVDAETLTEVFRETVNKNTVKVNVQSLSNFSPKVWLEPVEYLMGRENYKEIDEFCFIKGNVSENEDEVKLKQYHQDRIESSQEIIMSEKKQRFLDYYKNFSSFAVRELIAGKKIRESGNETGSIFRVSNVHNVFVCNFCSKSFLTETVLNMHCKRAHRSIDTPVVHVENNTVGKMQRYKKFMLRKIKKRRGRKKKQFSKNDTLSIGCNINNINFYHENANNIASTRFTVDPSDRISKINAQSQENCENLSSNNVRKLSLGLRTKSGKTNYNINSIVKNSSTVNNISNGPKRRNKKNVGSMAVKKRRKSKSKKSMESDTNDTYIWDRKGLGTYSAITFYRKHVTADSEVSCNEKFRDLNKKEDNALNETIRKLADRLEELENADNGNLFPT